MSEWLKEHAWKACVGETLPWVRIPLSPPSKSIHINKLRLSSRGGHVGPREPITEDPDYLFSTTYVTTWVLRVQRTISEHLAKLLTQFTLMATTSRRGVAGPAPKRPRIQKAVTDLSSAVDRSEAHQVASGSDGVGGRPLQFQQQQAPRSARRTQCPCRWSAGTRQFLRMAVALACGGPKSRSPRRGGQGRG